MISPANLSIFMLATIMLNITPGADMMYVIARSTGQGIKAGIVSALGIAAGCIVHIFAALAGLSAIVAQSATIFGIIKYLGAAYLIYLGVKSLLAKKSISVPANELSHDALFSIFRQGMITNVLNPKVALFFLAFLPQFVEAGSPGFAWQILFLGILFNTSGTIVNILVAVLFGKLGNTLLSHPRLWNIQQKVTGALLIGLGIRIALLSRK